MKATLTAMPIFYIQMTPEQVKTLEYMALQHYDEVCRSSARVGGFIYGWNNWISFAFPVKEGEDTPTIRATFRELDTCLKIMEMPPREEHVDLVRDLTKSFRSYLELANRTIPGFTHEVDA